MCKDYKCKSVCVCVCIAFQNAAAVLISERERLLHVCSVFPAYRFLKLIGFLSFMRECMYSVFKLTDYM